MHGTKKRSSDAIDKVLNKLRDVKPCGKGWSARCPAHDDQHPSLTVTEAENGLILMHCHAECSYENICLALGISNIVATYDYRDEMGKLLYQVTRTAPKGFFMRRPNGKEGFKNGLGDVRRMLYRLPELLKSDRQQPVFIPEGEKDVDALRRLGFVATCNSGGAGKWRDEYNRWLAERDVVVLPDNDAQGDEHAQKVANSLLAVAASVKLVRLPNLPAKGDVSNWLSAGGTEEQLLAFVEKAEILDSRLGTSMNRENIASGFTLTPLTDLLAEPEEPIPYVWDRTLPMGGFSICAAKPKVGKSTLARNLALAVAKGEDFFGRATNQGKVIYLSLEEIRAEITGHFRQMGSAGEDILVHTGRAPTNALQALSTAITQSQPALVIIDPLSRFLRVADFNSYGEVTKVLEPLIDLARESGCHILAVHHNGKGERDGGDSLLGSTAFFGAVDTLLIMRRKENNRFVYSEQRYGENLSATLAHLDKETGKVTPGGALETIQIDTCKRRVLESLGEETLTEPEIKERVGGNSTHTSKALRELCTEGAVQRTGAGKKGDPYLYAKISEAKSSILDFTPKTNSENNPDDDWKDAVNF
ncbi:MAG: AAA family ATPase [Acidobacteria bacterium]|nr:AAA family ATPase [Acidobacteriota bacterium]MCA1627663.1 AAA family ATPase [Acidobacteriota bacterium]